LQLLLGHADITTTTKYLDNDLAKLQREHHQRSPLESVRRRR
jgi:site-specific recombinase XerD